MRILVFLWLFFLPLCSVLFGIDIALVSGECLGGSRLCLEDERSLLLQLKNSLKFKPNVSVKLVTWNESVGCCSRGGVTWDSNGHVVGLELSSKLISGGFNSSSSLFSLRHLQCLNLANNIFNNSLIPAGFGKIGNLLNLGNNQMNGIFPCLLKNITTLRVLVLRGNKFQGSIGCPKSNSTWAMLQIVDLAFNNFNGKLPATCFSTWTAMMAGENEAPSKLKHLQFRILLFGQLYNQDAVTVTSKGLEMELVKVLTLYTSIDLSCNNLEGDIPEVMGNFTSLYVLNLSHNGFTGHIPSSIGNLRQLKSLDLSRNRLSGEIPTQLANLNFLSVLNLSFNQLVGRIPAGNQMQTFSETSYEGNKGLCGWPLNINCTDPPPSQDKRFQDKEEFDWEFIITGLGFGVGAGIIEMVDEYVDRFVLLILPIVRLLYTDYGRVEAEEAFGIELTDITGGYEDSDEEKDEIEFGSFEVRFCVFCSKLDIGMKKPIHDPNCSCHDSPPILSSSSSSSSSSSQI
ncbi:hypothetical protein PVL29_009804 [Vitis rotundifolia]|uniref:Leucine-rich repeat-containing N-terminal plant-type domain-containing protein n=1 Tax=Vitis rotundifolia TaxID=103349 RepID=A0AA38ZRP8_VITRO|nr:hypothetical protein PVL29_009804 [Vitis rotundifolia]